MKKIICHQYATGRGPSGYGFVAYSKNDPHKQEPTYSFSQNKTVGLRFSQLPAGVDYVFEVEPASTDYRHAGAFITRNREEGGSSSVYTHVLMTKEQPEGAEAFGLLKVDNFLTPDEFSQVTHSALNLEMTEKDCELPDVEDYVPLNQDQRSRLGEFLARYWALLEQKEWSGKGNPELALVLSGLNQTEMIAFFAREIIPCLPVNVRSSVSASFGATWNNRGSSPAVCCVIPDNSESPFPCYNPGIDGLNFARPTGPVEQAIGQMLVQQNHDLYPPTYCRIERFAKKENVYGNMARGFSVMAYCMQAQLANGSIPEMRKSYDALVTLADKRYGIKKDKVPEVLLPLIQDIFDQYSKRNNYSPDDVIWMLRQNIALHRSEIQGDEEEALKHNDACLAQGFRSLNMDQMKEILSILWTELKQDGLSSQEIYKLLKQPENALFQKHVEGGSIRLAKSAIEQCVRLDREAREEAKELTELYREWLCQEQNIVEMLKTLNASDSFLSQNEQLYFSLLEQIKYQPVNMDEGEIVNYINAIRQAKRKAPERADNLLKEAYHSIMGGVSKLKEVSSDSFAAIAETVLTQKQNKETIGIIFDFALRNERLTESSAFLKQAAANMVNMKEAEDPEYQQVLFEKLEQASESGNQFVMEDSIRKLLEKTNNTLPNERPLSVCERIKQARLTECIRQFFQETATKVGEDPGKEWNRLFAKKYSANWEELNTKDLEEPLGGWFSAQYENSDDPLELLQKSWSQAELNNKSEYRDALQKVIVKTLENNYDPLWQNGDEKQREELESLVGRCNESTQGTRLWEKCRKTTAGRARQFLENLNDLSRKGMHKNPEKAGELIMTMKNEHGFNQCIRIESQTEHNPDDSLYQLVIMLLQQMQTIPDSSRYWEEPLTELGFDRSVPVWSENGFRMLNILAYITKNLNDMRVSGIGEDLKEYLGADYMNQLWKESKADEKWFQGHGSSVLSEPLYQWMNN